MNNTIFDDVFRTMIEKMPYMAVPLINEVFHTSYPQDVPIVQLRNEHQQENGEIITDSCLKIGGKLYHIECQSVDDTTMAIRMIEYDFSIAVENAHKQGRRYRMDFPKSCVLYLRSGNNTPDFLEVELVLPDENTVLYRIPAIKLEAYTKDSIFEKNLLMLLPFYIMRYEKDIHEMSENPELFQRLLNEYEEIRMNLVIELSGADKTALYMDLNKLIIKIADYICQSEEVVRKGIGEIMGGKVLELESERLRAEGEIRGEIRGEAKGEERLSILINRLILDGRSAEIQSVVTNAEIRKQMYKEYGM
ncbi:hypothetical protein [Blautia difficilis]|uniref:hypothetical protein n=1 Tax=Blautia difficilis TaxID=2763027 RepID=UPI003D98FA5A